MTPARRLLPTLAGLVLLAGCGGSPGAPASSTPSSSPSSSPITSSAPSTSASADTPPSADGSPSAAPSPGVSVPASAGKFSDGVEYDNKVTVEVKQFENSGTTTTFTVEIANKGSDAISGPIDVQSSYGTGYTAAAPVDGGRPITVPVAAGKTVTGRYAFTIPSASRGKVYLDVAIGSDYDHAQFQGSVK